MSICANMKWVGVASFMVATSFGGCNCDEQKAEEVTIKINGPQSLTGKYASTSSKTISGAQAAIKWVNETYGGVPLADGSTGKLELKYSDDTSEAETVTTITQAACDDATSQFIIAPYSSGLTAAAADVAEGCKKIIMSHGGASDSLYTSDRAYIVGSIAPASHYHRGILDAIKAQEGSVGSLKVAFVYEDSSFSKTIQAAASAYAAELGFVVGYSGNYPGGASVSSDFDDVIAALQSDAPDIILGGGHGEDGRLFVQALDAADIHPKAFSLLVSPTDPDFYNLVQPCANCDYSTHPAEGISGPSQWEVGVGFSEDGANSDGAIWFGPSQQEFLDLYHGIAGADQSPSYHAANGAVMILSLVRAIEKAGTLDSDAVRAAFNDVDFMSFWGHWDIDENGMNTGHEMVEVQWQQGEKQIVWPESGKTAGFTYPINE